MRGALGVGEARAGAEIPRMRLERRIERTDPHAIRQHQRDQLHLSGRDCRRQCRRARCPAHAVAATTGPARGAIAVASAEYSRSADAVYQVHRAGRERVQVAQIGVQIDVLGLRAAR